MGQLRQQPGSSEFANTRDGGEQVTLLPQMGMLLKMLMNAGLQVVHLLVEESDVSLDGI